jgi:hypothetical protein
LLSVSDRAIRQQVVDSLAFVDGLALSDLGPRDTTILRRTSLRLSFHPGTRLFP